MLMLNVMRWGHCFFLKKEMSKFEKLMQIVTIEEENLQMFWTSWGIWMKFSEKLPLIIILKNHKKPGVHLFS